MPCSDKASSGSGRLASQTSRTSSRDSRAASAWSISDCLSLGLVIWSVLARTVSRSPNCWMSREAVFGPMPGTPGTLSTLSPISARTSPTLSGATPNFSMTLASVDAAVVHRVEHVDFVIEDQLHQILVGADDRHFPAGVSSRGHVAGDDVVGFQARFLDTRDRKGARRGADQRELRDKVLGRRRPVRLVAVVHLVAERLLRRIEDDRHVGRPVGLVETVRELPQHRRVAVDSARWLAMAVGQGRQAMVGTEYVARPVDQVEMGLRRGWRAVVGRAGGLGFRHEAAGLAGAVPRGQQWRSVRSLAPGGEGQAALTRCISARRMSADSTWTCRS